MKTTREKCHWMIKLSCNYCIQHQHAAQTVEKTTWQLLNSHTHTFTCDAAIVITYNRFQIRLKTCFCKVYNRFQIFLLIGSYLWILFDLIEVWWHILDKILYYILFHSAIILKSRFPVLQYLDNFNIVFFVIKLRRLQHAY